jgi:hypothetical protein
VAQNCCAQFQACRDDTACSTALEAYNGCVGQGTADVNSPCDEQVFAAMTGNTAVDDLTSCIFLSGRTCAATCTNQALGDVCETYCGCMQKTCCPTAEACAANIQSADEIEKVGTPTSCRTFCASFTKTQRDCRSYHCGRLARQSGVIPHCQHAVGLLSACP